MCDTVTPLPVVPSPNIQPYDVALVVALASKLHVVNEQLLVKLVTGSGAAFDTVTGDVFELVPFASVTVSVTENVFDVAYVWLVVTPLPAALPSPKVQLYIAPESAVELLPSKLQASSEQLEVKLATGGVGPAEMKAE